MYQWLITDDLVPDNKFSRVGCMGPRNARLTEEAIRADESAKIFRMLDDDGEVYYMGKIVGDYDGFEPLDDLGMPDAGCTEIQYWDKNMGMWYTV